MIVVYFTIILLLSRKKWHLFPPSQSDALYQTRIPYEESSVFSPVNIAKPDLKKFPQFSTATPYIVTLDPGDVLFVPRHWWHFVETVETAISVNTWIEMVIFSEQRCYIRLKKPQKTKNCFLLEVCIAFWLPNLHRFFFLLQPDHAKSISYVYVVNQTEKCAHG